MKVKRFLSAIVSLAISISAFTGSINITTASASNTEIKLGDYLQMGTYYGEPILWRCVSIDENGPLMLSDRILCLKAFDATGSNLTNTSGSTSSHGKGLANDRLARGSNYWGDSNIRDWLNSDDETVTWTCGNKPDASHVKDSKNAYDTEAGFLTNFTDLEKRLIKTVTQDSLIDYQDRPDLWKDDEYIEYNDSIKDVVQNSATAAKEQVTDKVFLLDINQIHTVYANGGTLGSNYYMGKPTAAAIANSNYTSSDLNTASYWYTWLRTPFTRKYGYAYGEYVRWVKPNGKVDNEEAYTSYGGVRPAFYFNTSCPMSGKGTAAVPYSVTDVSVKVGDYVQMGTYYNEPILWRCVDIDENGPLMLADKILCLKAFDAKGSVTTGSHGRGGTVRKLLGANYWGDSNIRNWLNSNESSVNWDCGNKPDSSHIELGKNPYDTEAGFLSNFTEAEQGLIKSVTQDNILGSNEYSDMSNYGEAKFEYNTDIANIVQNASNAYRQSFTDKMFLLDVKQANAMYNNSSILGDYYITKPTTTAVSNTQFTNKTFNSDTAWWYWLRTPYGEDDHSVRMVNPQGTVYSNNANADYGGIRPAFYLDLSKFRISSGLGTETSPYVPTGKDFYIGDYVQMGTYNNQPILWRCVDIDEHGALMLADKIICLKAFDAKGSVTTGSHGRGVVYWYDGEKQRPYHGSNYWGDSNIRDWLNSDDETVTWTCGNKPDKSHVVNEVSPYDTEAGFLTNFTESEKNAIKEVTQDSLLDADEYSDMSKYGSANHYYNSSISDVVQNAKTDAYREQITDKMFLLDVSQVNKVYQNDALLGGNSYFIGKPTDEAVDNSDYTSDYFAKGKNYNYWLRTPCAQYCECCICVRCVTSDGAVPYVNADYGEYGIRPAFYIDLDNADFIDGIGTGGSPYTVKKSGETLPTKKPSLTSSTDSGYYADTADSSDKVGIVSFTTKVDNLDSNSNITNFGMVIYNTDSITDGTKGITLEKTNNTSDVNLFDAGGYFYSIVKDIPSEDFAHPVYALPYVTINGTTIWGSVQTSPTEFTKWLGKKPVE